MQVWAHRGASGYAPENTLEAFQKAIELGADGIELDVQLTKDGEVVIIHDEVLERVSDGYGFVKDYTLGELKKLNFSKVMPAFTRPTTIPTLREVLQLVRFTKLVINIEIKTGRFCYEGLEEKTIEIVETYEMQDRVWYSSFNHYSLKKIKALCPQARCGVLYRDGIYKPMEYAKALHMDALHPAIYNLQYLCDESNPDIAIHPYTANTVASMAACVRVGADALITNYPDKARCIVEQSADGHYVFENPFVKPENKQYYVFGAGYIGQCFLKKYGSQYPPMGILDNGEAKWGTMLEGFPVMSPEILKGNPCVVIASAYYLEIIAQLETMGVDNYYVYDLPCEW